jgi:hypothetical protein
MSKRNDFGTGDQGAALHSEYLHHIGESAGLSLNVQPGVGCRPSNRA